MRTLILAILAFLLTTPGALAQEIKVSTGPDQIGGVPFSDVPYRVPSLGLAMRLPEGATVSSTSTVEGVRSFVVTPASKKWLLRVLGPRVSDPSMTPAGVIGSMIEELLDPDGDRDTLKTMNLTTKDGRKRVFDRIDALTTPTSTGARFYVRIAQPAGPELITGYSVFVPAPGQLVVFEINCLGPEFAAVQPVYEAIVAAATIRDPEQLASERAAGITAGQTLLADLDGETIAAMLPVGPEWTRLYRPGPTGRWSDDDEVAYQSLEIRKGRRGELSQGRSKRSWSASEREQGFVAVLRARYLENGQTIDILSSYFLSEDLVGEAWSVRMRVRDRFDSFNWTETGVRSGEEIRVSIAQPDGTVTEKSWPVPPEGYLSHVEALLLPRLLAGHGVEGEFAFYRYNSQIGELALRRDTFTVSADGWTLTTKAHEDAPADVLELDHAGALVSEILGGDVHGTSSEQKSIAGIWRHKGLPID